MVASKLAEEKRQQAAALQSCPGRQALFPPGVITQTPWERACFPIRPRCPSESSRPCPPADGHPKTMKCPGARASCPHRAWNCGTKCGQDARAPRYSQSRGKHQDQEVRREGVRGSRFWRRLETPSPACGPPSAEATARPASRRSASGRRATLSPKGQRAGTWTRATDRAQMDIRQPSLRCNRKRRRFVIMVEGQRAT